MSEAPGRPGFDGRPGRVHRQGQGLTGHRRRAFVEGGDHGRRRRADIQSPSVARSDRRGDGGDIDGEVDEGEWPKRLHHLTDDLRLHGCDGSTGAGVATTTSGCT